MMMTKRRLLVALIASLVASAPALGAATAVAAAAVAVPDRALQTHILAAFASLHSYKLTVLGSVRSTGVWVAPNRYHMTTEIDGKPLETVIVGRAYWTKNGARWEQSGTTGTNLDVDVAGLVAKLKAGGGPIVRLAPRTQSGKTVGEFTYTSPDDTDETCDYDPKTYRISRCKSDEVTLLYSAFNDPKNAVPKV